MYEYKPSDEVFERLDWWQKRLGTDYRLVFYVDPEADAFSVDGAYYSGAVYVTSPVRFFEEDVNVDFFVRSILLQAIVHQWCFAANYVDEELMMKALGNLVNVAEVMRRDG